MKPETVSFALNELDERHICDTVTFSPGAVRSSPERIVIMKKKKIITFALAAALMLALGITAYAVFGIPHSVGTHPMPKTAEYTSLEDLPKIEKDIGYPVTVPEHFSNGYDFAGLRVDGQAVFGENNEVLKEYYAVNATYSKESAADLYLEISPVPDLEGGNEAPVPSEQKTVNGVTVNLYLDHYKVVPADYKETEEDLAREAAGHYYISFGSDEIAEYDMAFADFEMNGAIYNLMDMSADDESADMLIGMASEIISGGNT